MLNIPIPMVALSIPVIYLISPVQSFPHFFKFFIQDLNRFIIFILFYFTGF